MKHSIGGRIAGAAAVSAAFIALAAFPANAADCGGSTPGAVACTTEVKGVTVSPQGPTVPAIVPAGPAVSAGSGALPVTGSDVGVLASAGAALVGVGAVLTIRSRRTSPSEA